MLRRVLLFSLITWVPLFLLSLYGGQLLSNVHLGFLRDLETHARFLVALPVLIGAEIIVHKRTRTVVKRFVEGRIVTAEETPRFHAAIETALRARNSVPIELGMLILVYTVGHWIWLNKIAFLGTTWYGVFDVRGFHLSLAGYWNAFVSVPIFQFILLRWYFRILIWFWLLWKISTLKLRLMPAHPDHAGGIGFLGRSSYAFSPLLFAQGALLSGVIASRVLFFWLPLAFPSPHLLKVACFQPYCLSCCAPPDSSGASLRQLFPQFNLHKARIRRKPARLPPSRFTESAPEHLALVNYFAKSALPIKPRLLDNFRRSGRNHGCDLVSASG